MSPINPLNPAAGDVAIPFDPREVDAAVRASRVSYRGCLYYRWRFGDYGEAFSRSDSAWLVTLTESSQELVNEQVLWLAGLLSNRGIPYRLLEMHLDVLLRVLIHSIPEKKGHYGKLSVAKSLLVRDRRERIPDDKSRKLASRFGEGLGHPESRLLRETGTLIVAGVADEMAGVKYAVTRLDKWLTDTARFEELDALPWLRARAGLDVLRRLRPPDWSESVDDLIRRARLS